MMMCYNCNGENHLAEVCTSPYGAKDLGGAKCENCKGLGHTRKDCPSEGGGKFVFRQTGQANPKEAKAKGKGAKDGKSHYFSGKGFGVSSIGSDGVVYSDAEWAAWSQQEQTTIQSHGAGFIPSPAMPWMTSAGPSPTPIASLQPGYAGMNHIGMRSMSSLSMKRPYLGNERDESNEEATRTSAMNVSMQDLVNIGSVVGKNRRRRDNAREAKRQAKLKDEDDEKAMAELRHEYGLKLSPPGDQSQMECHLTQESSLDSDVCGSMGPDREGGHRKLIMDYEHIGQHESDPRTEESVPSKADTVKVTAQKPTFDTPVGKTSDIGVGTRDDMRASREAVDSCDVVDESERAVSTRQMQERQRKLENEDNEMGTLGCHGRKSKLLQVTQVELPPRPASEEPRRLEIKIFEQLDDQEELEQWPLLDRTLQKVQKSPKGRWRHGKEEENRHRRKFHAPNDHFCMLDLDTTTTTSLTTSYTSITAVAAVDTFYSNGDAAISKPSSEAMYLTIAVNVVNSKSFVLRPCTQSPSARPRPCVRNMSRCQYWNPQNRYPKTLLVSPEVRLST